MPDPKRRGSVRGVASPSTYSKCGPVRPTPAHQTADFAELVCSNSLKSDSENTAPWLLKEEMRRAGSRLLEIARATAVPAGHALAVDRAEFSRNVTEAISREPLITIRREEATQICDEDNHRDRNRPADLRRARPGNCALEFMPSGTVRASRTEVPAPQALPTHLYFYDSISPIVEADSIDMSKVYLAARYDKGSADYINCPMSKDEYDAFYDALSPRSRSSKKTGRT